jgi:hypothetical protein
MKLFLPLSGTTSRFTGQVVQPQGEAIIPLKSKIYYNENN